jgi:hypothetical protein
MPILSSFSLAAGAWIFAAFIVVWLIAIAYGYYTRRGSAINQRTYASVDAPGAKTPGVLPHDRSAARRLIMGARRRAESSGSAPDERHPKAGRAGRGRPEAARKASRRRA